MATTGAWQIDNIVGDRDPRRFPDLDYISRIDIDISKRN